MSPDKKFVLVTIGLLLFGASIFLFGSNLTQASPILILFTGFVYIMSGALWTAGSICLAYSFSYGDKKPS